MIEDDDKSSRGEESRGKSQEPESRGKSQERESRGKSQDSLEVANEKEEDGREATTAESAVSIHEPSSVTEEEVCFRDKVISLVIFIDIRKVSVHCFVFLLTA